MWTPTLFDIKAFLPGTSDIYGPSHSNCPRLLTMSPRANPLYGWLFISSKVLMITVPLERDF